ncbi:NAD-dependent succinate-semialdehyde dehydrogenase [Effusibacillus lacus]|uniref:NAD-dependent succinate-semialdehyde dehydrogenase n=1 Tax=Effusibacillus lacus TaxID=1348429 RepID=A0A292YHC6_9BACL|nr:NAD-dependent succinate-semialdehyde dehydrogenase [Effusibacillus lacus]TCS75095.1 succinate semialdehyde dehydrogenase [Effusibacillus lacus]GAX89048.1 NAD-dependent succinate-semialdehyde dehydrogenase [Effusibacillus lacus]
MSDKYSSKWNFMWIFGQKVTLPVTVAVRNPATGEVTGHVPKGGQAETTLAIEAAWRSFPQWSRMPAKDRAVYLLDWADRILDNREELAALLTQEQGKPLAEARGEIEGAAEFVRWYAEEGKRAYGELIPASRPRQRILVMRQPVGVAGLITPWNFPAAMVTRKAAPALAAGCTVVLKPAKQTPQIAVALFQHLMDTGIPAGVANLVTGDAVAIGGALLSDPRVRKISFTGSTEVGKNLMRQAADQVKRLSLELGGNAPVIVFPDADLDKAANAIVSNKFENCGQVCNGINVIYVHKEIAGPLTEKIVTLVKRLKIGNGMDPEVTMGPLIDETARAKVEAYVADAVEKGARVRTGGYRLETGGCQFGSFYAPTVLEGVTREMALTREEVFGPVAPVVEFESEEEVLAYSNETSFGLAAYFFTRDTSRVFRMAEGLEFGMVAVNGTSLSVPQAPFGGIKESGTGREGGHHGLEDYMEYKYVALTLE